MISSVGGCAHCAADLSGQKIAARLTTSDLHRHEPLANDAPEMGPGNELLPHIAAFGEADGIQAVQIILQRYSMSYKDSPMSVQTPVSSQTPVM